MTTVTVHYDCGCRYTVPTSIPDTGSALRHHAAVDTIAALADAAHEQECPQRPQVRGEGQRPMTGLDEMTTVAALQTRLRHAEAALARIRELLDAATPHNGQPPANGTLLVAEYRGGPNQVDDERAWLRDDQEHADPCGDWFWIGAKDRRTWGEVMWWDDPAGDRGTVHLSAYLPVDDLRNALKEDA